MISRGIFQTPYGINYLLLNKYLKYIMFTLRNRGLEFSSIKENGKFAMWCIIWIHKWIRLLDRRTWGQENFRDMQTPAPSARPASRHREPEPGLVSSVSTEQTFHALDFDFYIQLKGECLLISLGKCKNGKDELILTHGLAEETVFHEAFHLSSDQNSENDGHNHFSVNVRQKSASHPSVGLAREQDPPGAPKVAGTRQNCHTLLCRQFQLLMCSQTWASCMQKGSRWLSASRKPLVCTLPAALLLSVSTWFSIKAAFCLVLECFSSTADYRSLLDGTSVSWEGAARLFFSFSKNRCFLIGVYGAFSALSHADPSSM